MHLDLTAEQHSLRKQLRSYYRDLFTPELRAALNAEWDDMGGSVFRQVVARMGADGWLGIGWPKEYGGQGRGPIEQLIFWEETYRARAPLPIIAVNTIGPIDALRHRRTEARNAARHPARRAALRHRLHGAGGRHRPRVAHHARRSRRRRLGHQRPEDLHDPRPRRRLHLARRPHRHRVPKHKASRCLVPTSSPASATPIHTLGGERTNATYYQDVRVPVANTIGPVNGGWTLITSQLNHERITLATPGVADRALDEVWAWATKTEKAGGGRIIDEPWVQQNLARCYASSGAKLLNWRSAWSLEVGHPNMARRRP
jgi:alkylation response protein AidB-like acyl-CoA dehydrogenase